MERITAIFTLFIIPLIIVGCAVRKQKESARMPASVMSPMDAEVDAFIEDIENEKSSKY